jgi:hypothetical protein
MYGDISRITFDPTRRFSRVVYQQGRVFLDADPNEQTEILLDLQRSFIAQLTGAHGGFKAGAGFGISDLTASGQKLTDFAIGTGPYYVDGIASYCGLREGGDPFRYFDQKAFTPHPLLESKNPGVVYLDVWERYISALEDDAIREVALGGPDTSGRTEVVWRVNVSNDSDLVTTAKDYRTDPTKHDLRAALTDALNRKTVRTMTASIKPEEASTDPCTISPDSRYRGLENQLYRVEINGMRKGKTVYTWSRDNGSIGFRVLSASKAQVRLASLGRDSSKGLGKGSVVELLNDERVLRGEPGILATVDDVRLAERIVTLTFLEPGDPLSGFSDAPELHPLLRRWDGWAEIDDTIWQPLEAGIQIKFGPNGDVHPRDYWLIPARLNSGTIEWPKQPPAPRVDPEWVEQPPRGIIHHYAPLALIEWDAGSESYKPQSLRNIVKIDSELEQ